MFTELLLLYFVKLIVNYIPRMKLENWHVNVGGVLAWMLVDGVLAWVAWMVCLHGWHAGSGGRFA